jgi:hypothetical protein
MNGAPTQTPLLEWHCELTDTFGGEANYSWIRRETLQLPAGPAA